MIAVMKGSFSLRSPVVQLNTVILMLAKDPIRVLLN